LIYSAMAVYAVAFIIYAFDLFGPAFAGEIPQAGSKPRSKVSAAARRGAAGGGTATAVLEGGDDATGPAADSGSTPTADSDAGSGSASDSKGPDLRRWARAGTALTVLAGLLHVA